MQTLEDALATGRGDERPFRCHVHEDSNASASVNVVKGVWFCHSCHAKGRVDGDRVPTVQELEGLLEPERSIRRYPESWLAVFGRGGYWADRFSEWLCWYAGFGTDPWTGEGTYPVRTMSGLLAGVCRRSTLDVGPKYRYPRGWSAAQQLGLPRGALMPSASGLLVLTEGYADAAALWEVGIPAACTFGAGLHLPQLEHLSRLNVQTLVLGFDADEAGAAAAERTEVMWGTECAWVDWSEWNAKDPAELDPQGRVAAVSGSVAGVGEHRASHLVQQWHVAAQMVRQAYVEEAA